MPQAQSCIIIEPMGFRINEKSLKEQAWIIGTIWMLQFMNCYNDFVEQNPNAKIWYATTKAPKRYSDVEFGPDDYIMLEKKVQEFLKKFCRQQRTVHQNPNES